MNFARSLALLAALACASSAFAEDPASCSSVRLDGPGGAFEHYPPYIQAGGWDRDLQICYAISAAELIDVHTFNVTGHISRSSPISVALYSNPTSEGVHLDVGDDDDDADFRTTAADLMAPLGGQNGIDMAISASSGRKICDQDWFAHFVNLNPAAWPSEDRKTPHTADQFITDVLQEVEALKTHQTTLQRLKDRADSLPSYLSCAAFETHTSLSNIADALAFAAKKATSKAEQVNFFIEQACRDHETVREGLVPKKMEKKFSLDPLATDNPRASDIFRKENLAQASKFEKQIDSLLDTKPPIAVGLGIDTEVMKTGEIDGALTPTHAQVLIGRRFNSETHQCEYLVRNSYGEKCRHLESWGPCENGSNWVSAARLMTATQQLVWIPNSPAKKAK